jgi:hypothetical protein
MTMAGMSGMEEGSWAAKLFSSALFCLWLSLASVTVWFDAGSSRAPMSAQTASSDVAANQVPVRAGDAVNGHAPVPDGTQASPRDASLTPSRPTSGDGVEPDAA